jgi:hypothetical protein
VVPEGLVRPLTGRCRFCRLLCHTVVKDALLCGGLQCCTGWIREETSQYEGIVEEGKIFFVSQILEEN